MSSLRKIRVIAFRLHKKAEKKAKEKALRHKDAEQKRTNSKYRKEVKAFLGFDRIKIKGKQDVYNW